MPTLTPSDSSSLKELLASATTAEDLQALDSLLKEREGIPEQHEKPWIVETLADVAEFFGLAVQTVKQWRTEAVKMPGEAGKWNLADITRWRIEKISKSGQADRRKEAETRLAEAKAAQLETEQAKRRGELIEREDVERWAAVAIAECRERIMALPGMIAAGVAQEQQNAVRAETERHCRDVLNTLAEKLGPDELSTECSTSI